MLVALISTHRDTSQVSWWRVMANTTQGGIVFSCAVCESMSDKCLDIVRICSRFALFPEFFPRVPHDPEGRHHWASQEVRKAKV